MIPFSEILVKARAEKAAKVFVNSDDAKDFLDSLPYNPLPLRLDRATGLLWFRDDNLGRGEFRLEPCH